MTLKTRQENTKNYYFAFSNSDTNCLQTDDAENTKSRIHNSFNNIYLHELQYYYSNQIINA